MAISVLNNIAGIAAQNQLSLTSASLQKTLLALSSGSRINNGADDAAGLAIADGLRANISALTQSAQNANQGAGILQVADGALAQVTNLLNRAVTLATSAANGTISNSQRTALDTEFTAIKAEITRIGTDTNYNGQAVFGFSGSVLISDGGTNSNITATVATLSSSSVGKTPVDISARTLTSASNATTALGDINSAIAQIAAQRGDVGASINRLQSASAVINAQVQNLSAAEDGIRAADLTKEVANMTKFNILQQTGLAALAQSNQMQSAVLSLLK